MFYFKLRGICMSWRKPDLSFSLPQVIRPIQKNRTKYLDFISFLILNIVPPSNANTKWKERN